MEVEAVPSKRRELFCLHVASQVECSIYGLCKLIAALFSLLRPAGCGGQVGCVSWQKPIRSMGRGKVF
jgi:hypothetical protein